MDMRKVGLVAIALVMMSGLVGCGTQFEKDLGNRAGNYTLVGGLLGPVGTVAAFGVAGVVTAVDAVSLPPTGFNYDEDKIVGNREGTPQQAGEGLGGN